jgi:hypothetical protein
LSGAAWRRSRMMATARTGHWRGPVRQGRDRLSAQRRVPAWLRAGLIRLGLRSHRTTTRMQWPATGPSLAPSAATRCSAICAIRWRARPSSRRRAGIGGEQRVDRRGSTRADRMDSGRRVDRCAPSLPYRDDRPSP